MANMVANLQEKSGRSMSWWINTVLSSNKTKHGEMVAYLKEEHSLTHGYANLVAHAARQQSRGGPVSEQDLVTAQYVGKDGLRPIYEALIQMVSEFGNDVLIAPKKAGVSLRRSRQFALIEPATKTRIDIGINLKGASPTDRLKAAGGMCTHKVALISLDQIDTELSDWLRLAYQRA
jgi:hypothetical protein